MDLGSGVALATLTITTGVVLIKYVPKAPRTPRENGKCAYHDGIVKTMNELCIDQKTTKRLVMAIASKMDISINDIKKELQDLIGGGE